MSRTSRAGDLLARLAAEHPFQGDVIRLPGAPLCFADPAAARAVLGNPDGMFREHSDFFHTRHGVFGPRAAQMEIARNGRLFLRERIGRLAAAMPEAVDRSLIGETEWPDAGNRLVYGLTSGLLLGPHREPSLRSLLDEVFERGVLAGARTRYTRLERARFRRRAFGELAEAVRRNRRGGRPPEDLLDIVAGAGGTASDRDVAEVFVSHLFALAGSVGFALGWSVLLAGTSPRDGAPHGWVVREALRLWPIAWLFGRTAAREHELSGTLLRPSDDVVVCSYLVHRHPDHWPEPDAFRPERWAGLTGPPAYVPFGWGAHSCTGAAVALEVAERLLDEIFRHEVRVTARGTWPYLGPALAPPPFSVRVTARTATG